MALDKGPRNTKASLADIELVLFDVDNTLVDNESPDMPTDRFKMAADEAKKYVKIGLASARGLPKLAPIMKHLDINGLSIMLNGSQVYDYQRGEYLANWDITPEVAEHILSALDNLNAMHWINDNGEDYFPDVSGDKTVYRQQIDPWDRASELDKSTNYVYENPVLIVAASLNEAQVKQVRQLVEESSDSNITSLVVHETKSGDGTFRYDVLIINKDANKRHALHELLKIENLDPSHALVAGDGRNDEVMVATAGIGVAMSNAAEQTLNVATHIAPNQWEDGAAVVLEELVQAKES